MTVTAGHAASDERKIARDRMARWYRPALGLISPVAAAVLWELAVRAGLASGRLVPPPSVIFATFTELAQTGERDPDCLCEAVLSALRTTGLG